MMNVVVIDYGMGNLGSVRRAFEECGASRVLISDDPKALSGATHIVLPGVGAFANGMAHLEKKGWIEEMTSQIEQGIPMLGICLGMQLLAETGYEGGQTRGLGFIPGTVNKLIASNTQTRIPHVGWNEVYESRPSVLFKGISPGTDFYFVHSFHLAPSKNEFAIGTTPYCGDFVSAVQTGNIFGVQFHPEKSAKAGFQILRNFLSVR